MLAIARKTRSSVAGDHPAPKVVSRRPAPAAPANSLWFRLATSRSPTPSPIQRKVAVSDRVDVSPFVGLGVRAWQRVRVGAEGIVLFPVAGQSIVSGIGGHVAVELWPCGAARA